MLFKLKSVLYLLQVNLFQPKSIRFNLRQLLLRQTKKIFFAPSIFSSSSFFSSSPLYLPHLLFPPPPLLSQHPNLYSFYLNAHLGSLEPQTFGFPLDLCPDALPVSHAELDASSAIFLITYIHCSSNKFP